uniref:Uncharacterized protein n=1 Tax=Glossina palpalis gambiensis TaxID=67801 RepID=A0A1B0BD77_9MUSC
MNTLRPTNDLFLFSCCYVGYTIIWNARSRRSVVFNNNAYGMYKQFLFISILMSVCSRKAL